MNNRKMKKYLVTGASGFVARHFFNYLDTLQETIEVLGIDIKIPDNMNGYIYSHIKLRFIEVNLLDYPIFESAIVSFQPTHILHLASFSSVSKSWNEPTNSFINNTNIFLNLVEIVRNNKIACRILSIGSSEEYGNVPAESIPTRETTPLHPISPYAIARVSQEMLSQCYVASYKLDIVLTRSFNHIGSGQRDIFVIPSLTKQILEYIKSGQSGGIKLFTGDVSIIRDFLDVRDVVRAYHLLLEKGIRGEIYNVCSGTGRSLSEIIDMLSNLLDIKITIEIDEKRIRPGDNKVIIGDNNKIKEQTGWYPKIPFIDSLRDIVIYWKQILDIE
jgi:GDP-4-dehydro-6-deoxy-D-mannose reductase